MGYRVFFSPSSVRSSFTVRSYTAIFFLSFESVLFCYPLLLCEYSCQGKDLLLN